SGTAGDADLLPLRPLRDEDSLLAALDESVTSPARAVARVDSGGALAGVTGRAALHEHAARHHAAAARTQAAATSGTETGDEPGPGAGQFSQDDVADAPARTPGAGA
ncbi:MAG TPA: ABC transporter ATP-binding protein, partial [Streptomyces sp.]|nr:ABC transporter ATP-binding protein [Streptomyces sp.]